MKRMTAILALCVGAAWSGTALAQQSIMRTSSFAYDPASGLLTQEVIEPSGSPAINLTTNTSYDVFGNKIQVTQLGGDGTSRTASTTYDSLGQFVTSTTNGLGQTDIWQFDPVTGRKAYHLDPNGLPTSWYYDSFGRKTLEVRPDGTRTAYSYQFCNGVNGGTAGCAGAQPSYLISATPLASDGYTVNGPTSVIYFDSLNRELGRDTQGFNGSTVRARRLYDNLGRVQETTRPFFLGGAWQITTYTYDALGRVVTKTLPDQSTTQYAYHGLTTTETNALGQMRTVIKDAEGDVTSVTDTLNNTINDSMTYTYDPLGELLTTQDAANNAVTAAYDQRGRKLSSSDPDLGTWSYTYDALSELTQQIDAKGQRTTFQYDALGRTTERDEPDMVSTWKYDQATMGIGKLALVKITSGPGTGYQRSYGYDSYSRPAQVSTTIPGSSTCTASTPCTFSATYDINGRLAIVNYPSGSSVQYSYNSLGYANQLADAYSGQTLWTLNALDAEQHITQETAGNGVQTNQTFDPETGRLLTTAAGVNNSVQNFIFSYDVLGNLLTRDDAYEQFTERFQYDGLNRVTSANLVSTSLGTIAKSFTYDVTGNLTGKSDVGNYSYPTPGQAQPHAVTKISNNSITTQYYYDANGNQTSSSNGRTIDWTSYNKPASISLGAQTISFLDDPKHQRFQQVTPQGTTLYFGAFGVRAEYVVGSQTWNEYLAAGSVPVGVRFNNLTSETLTTRYFHTDHLGSISVITDEFGNVKERLSYDAWGKRRAATGADDPGDTITSETTRGFTDQEELSIAPLVHLNGRVYDTQLARMISADPTVPDPLNPQAYNRYSYVGNDPLTFTDPSGYDWLSNFFGDLGALVRDLFEWIIPAIVSTIPGVGPFVVIMAAAASSALITGMSGGDLSAVIRNAAIAGFTAAAFSGIAQATGHNPAFGTPEYVENVAGHATVGCLSAAASGGKCGSGALSGAAGAGVAPIAIQEGFVGGTALSAVVGGLASVAGGGKFADGAITGAFGYLFNSSAGRAVGRVIGTIVGSSVTGPEDVPLDLIGGIVGGEIGDLVTGPDAASTIGELLSGSDPDTLIHLTPSPAADFEGGVNPGTFFARLGDVSDMTVPEYQANVVGVGGAAGPGQPVNGFVLATPGSGGTFTEAGVFNNAGVMEYNNSDVLVHSGYVPLH